MTSVEKRRSGRKSGGHRKHSDGGSTSSGGSFLDETDREVSNLTDRAFRSLCIGDEAVYNDSDLCSSSPCTQKDRQLAFSQSGHDRDSEREELKRAAHSSFSSRMQQYGQDWIHGGMYGAEIQRDPQWEAYSERTQGRISATFQHSFVGTSQQEPSLGEEQLSFLSNGVTELSSQQRRSRSRVSSLIRAFNSEGQRDGAGMDGKLREWNDETSWDKSALMSIQSELSEFSTSYQQNFNSGHFPPAGPFTSQDTNFYSSEVAALDHMNSASTFMRSSHSKHSMSTHVNCNSNFFIHSEFSPFKVWRDHNRFPFQQGDVSGFMHCSEFPKWYETPMYKELSLDAQPQGPYRFEERGFRHPRNNLAPVIHPTLPRSTSTSTILHKASAVEKRCESELTCHYPNRKRTQSLGTNRLQSQRPSTASPTSEMSRRVQDTISSVKALQQRIKMMTEQNITTGMTSNEQGILCSNDNLIPFSNNAMAVAPNVVSINTSTTPFSISQLLTPVVHAHQEAETSEVRQYAVSPQPVEHPPVRAESRGATPDVRMSSYKSRATSLLFNLKDNRKRVKSTYSPPKFKGLETLEKSKQPSIQDPKDTVIDIPDFPDPDIQFLQVEESIRTNAAPSQHVNQYHSPGLSLTTPNSKVAHAGQYSDYTSSDYQRAQMQSEMVHHSRFTESYPSNQLANKQNLLEDLSSITAYTQGMTDNVQTLGGDVYRLKPSYRDTETPRTNAYNNQPREYLISKANAEQHFNETLGREFTKLDRYQQLKDNKHDYSNVSSQDRWRQTNSQETENIPLKAVSPWKPEITALMVKENAYQRAAAIKEDLNSPRDKYRGQNQQSINNELEKIELRESFGVGTSSHTKTGLVTPNISKQLAQNAPFTEDTIENPAHHGQQQLGAFKDKYELQKYYGHKNGMKDNCLTQNYNRYTDQEYKSQYILSNEDKSMLTQETGQRKQHTPIPKVYEKRNLQAIESRPQFEHNMQKKSLFNPDNESGLSIANHVKDRQFVEVKAEQAMVELIKAQHTQAELAKAQHWAQVEQPKVESARLNLAGQTGSEKGRAEDTKAELTEHDRVNQVKANHTKDEKRKEEQTDQSREKQPEHAREEQTKTEQTKVQKVTKEPRNMTKEVGAEHLREEQGEQVKANQTEAERLKEEHINTELAKAKQVVQAKSEQAKTERVRRERIEAEQIEKSQLRADQVEREWIKAEQITTEKVKAEQVQTVGRKAEQAKLEQIQEQQAKAVQAKTKVVEVGKVKANHIQVEDVKLATHISKTKERKAEQANQTTAENIQKGLANPSEKPAVTQQIKNEPDKVEQVKTELAKAKAELAKIKEKMRGEQKEKVRNTVLTKEDGIRTNVHLKVNKNEDHKDQATQMHQQKEDSVVASRQYSGRANLGAEEYERLREKYGFTDTTSPNRRKMSAAGNVSSNDAQETPALSLDNFETSNKEKLKDKSSPTSRVATANTENEEVGSLKPTELPDNQYVYSESSKEFKLSGCNYVPINVDKRANSDTVNDKVKDDSVIKLDKCDPLKHTDISQQRNLDLAKPLPLERKAKSTEHSSGPLKDQHFTPPRVLSNRERAQTKQEILTSKIKAHAEKEISAIKEKGFAVRDGFISKNSTMQLAGSQNHNIQQKLPSQEESKKHENTVSSDITPKHQMELSGQQMETVTSVSFPSSSIIPVRSAATTSHIVDLSQKQVPKEPMKSNDNAPQLPIEAKQMGSCTLTTDEGLGENQKKEYEYGIKSPISKEQAPTNKQGKQEANQGEVSGKQKEGLKDNRAENTDNLKRKNEDPSLPAVVVKDENSKPLTTEKAEIHEAVHEDSAPSLNVVFGQSADDRVQITGIMVTVRERKPSMDNGLRNDSPQEQIHVKEKELDKCNPCSNLDIGKGNRSSNGVSIVKLNDGVVQNSHTAVKEDQTKVGMNNHPENVQETLETRQNNVSENVTVKMANFQQGSSSVNARPQRVTQLQELLAKKVVPSTVTVPSKNKALAETQTLLYKQDKITSETKDHTNVTPNLAKTIRKDEVKSNTEERCPTSHTNENFKTKLVNTAINYTNDPKRADAETLIKHNIQPSVKEDMEIGMNPSKSKNTYDKSALLEEEKRCDSAPPNPFNKTSPSHHLTENENVHVPPEHQYKETHSRENNNLEDNVQIGSISIRVVPAVTQDNLKMMGKHDVNGISSNVVAANEHQQVASSSLEEKVNTLKHEDVNRDLTPASSEKQMKESSEDRLGIQCVLSSVKKINQQSSINTTSENTKAENGKPEKLSGNSRKSVDESTIRNMVGDYFQVQGVEETNEPDNNTNVGDTSDAVSKGREHPGLLPRADNKTAVSNDSCDEGKHDVFVLDQSIRKIAESTSAKVQDKKPKRKTEDNLASKQSDGPAETQSNKNDEAEAGHIRKQHTENQSSLSARERQSSRCSHPTKENIAIEKPEVKPKPKERISTIPEISALADYARLKVIVSEDEANKIQEFPPSKKEGFFPLIHTRHSRRPLFTANPQDCSVKEKRLPNKTEVVPKLNKEAKPLVFPITEKEHQRTGMFKLGDKERQEKMLLDPKANEVVSDAGARYAQQFQERNKSPTAHLKNQGRDGQVGRTDTQRVCQVEQSIQQPNNPPSQATTSFSAVKRPRSTSVSQLLKPFDNSNTHEKPVGQMHTTEENQAPKIKAEDRAEDERVKHLLEENKASLDEEERRTTQREEERRVRERETITIKIRERRERQREEERRAEEERVTQKEEKMRAKQREEERRIKEIEEKRRLEIEEEHQVKLREEKEQKKEGRRGKQQEEERAAHEEQKWRAAQEEQQRRAAQEEQQRRAAQEEQQWRAAQEEQRRRAAQEEQQRRAAQEEQQRAAQEEQQRRAVQEEQQRRAAQEEQQRAAQEEQQRIAAQEEQQRRAAQEEQQRAAQEEQQRRAAQEEQQRRAAQEEQQRRDAQEEQQRRAVQEEQQRGAAQEEQQRRAAQEEQQGRDAQEEQQRRDAQEEQQWRAAQEVQQRRDAQEEQQRRDAQEEQQRRAAQEKQQRAAQEEQQRRAAQEEQRRAAQEEQQRRAAQEEQQRRDAQEEQQRRAVQEEQQWRAAQEEQQRRAAQEQQRRAAREEQQRRAVQEEQEWRVAQGEQQWRAAQEEQQRRAAQEEQQRAVQEEQQWRAAQEEQQRRAAQEEQQRRAEQEEQQRRAAQEEQQRRAVQEEQQRGAAQEEQQRGAAQEEQQRRAAQEEQQRRAAQEEQQRRAAQEEQQRRAAAMKEQRQTKHTEEKIHADIEEKKKINQREEEKAAQISDENRIKQIQEQKKAVRQIEEQRVETQQKGEWMRTQREEEEERRAVEKEKTIAKYRQEKQAKEERTRLLEESQAALKEEEKRVAQERMLAQREDERAKKREEEELAAHREKERAAQMEEQKRAAQRLDALQYYAITSAESERNPRERHNPSGLGSIEDSGSHTRPYRPHAPASPAPSLPRSNTSSPALGAKPSMFRVKDNTFRGSSFIKSVKPRFHKKFGEDFRVGSPMEKGEEEQEIMRRSAGTPVYPETVLNRLAAIKESSAFQPAYSSKDYSAPLPHHRPYSRRSIALDEDDSRSVISNMSEDVESFATSAADLGDIRGLYDYDRPESACSISSDVSRSLGKPPSVPPKSDKALRRAQRLTTRRIKKELSKTATNSSAGVEKHLQEVSSVPSSSTEVRSSSRQAVALPHFASPVSLAHAPLGSSLPSQHTEHKSSHSSFNASPHATNPISLPLASPHATAPVSHPVALPKATGPASYTAAPKTVAHIPSSPTLHHTNYPAPVTQYHIESYPMTQRKVLQDLGSGQYFVVDVPIQVKTKTFFDPDTGKYVQLNVRESAQSNSRPQQTYPQPQLQHQMQIKLQQQSQASPAGKPFVLYQGNHGYAQDYPPPAINSVPVHMASSPLTLCQDQQCNSESHGYGYPTSEMEQNSEEHRYSPEKTPYMDTVNDKGKRYNTVNNTHGPYGSFPESDTNSQLAGSSVCENDNSARSQCQPRDIITMSELEDFMEVSDW